MTVPAAFIGVILIWSTTPLAIKWSGEEAGFLFGVTTRMLIGAALCVLLAAALRIPLPLYPRARHTYLAAGLGIFLAMSAVYWGAQFIPSGWVAVVFGLAPIVTGVIAYRWLAEPFTFGRLGGMLLGLLGLTVVFLGSQRAGPQASLGVVGVLLSVVAHSASSVAVKRIGAPVPAFAVTTGGLLVAVPLFLLSYLLSGKPLPATVSPRTGWSIVYLGLLGSVVGFALYYYVLKHVEATRVALLTLVTPLLALAVGYALNDESVPPELGTGTAIILSGLLLFEFGDRALARLTRAG